MDNAQKDRIKLLIRFMESLEDDYIGVVPGKSFISDDFLARLPNDFTEFLKWSNGFSIFGTEVLGLNNAKYDLLKTMDWEYPKKHKNRFLISFSEYTQVICMMLKDSDWVYHM